MELMILGAVGLVGYQLSQPAKRPVVPAGPYMSCTDPRSIAQADDAVRNASVDMRNIQRQKANFRASMNPHETGVIAAPFFRSDKSAATSDAYKQDRLELFTGQLDKCQSQTGSYLPKRESGPMFDPAISRAPVTSSGRQAYVTSDTDTDRYQPGLKQHNTGPVNPAMVGPGLGLGPDTPAAGGFQQFFRICPENVNGYRKNNLPGRIVPGKALNPGGANIGTVNHKVQKPVWDLGRMPLTASMASVTAPSQYGQQGDPRRQDATEGFAGHAFGGNLAPGVRTAQGRGRTDDRFCGTILNAAGTHTGGYVTQKNGDPGAFRQPLGAFPVGPVSCPEQGGFQAQRTQLPCTQREQPGFQPSVSGVQRGQAIRNQQVKQTGRETLSQSYVNGPAGGAVPAPAVTIDAGIDRNKPDTCVGYMPNGSTLNTWNPQMTTARLREPDSQGFANHGGMASVNYGLQGNNTSCMNKLAVQNQFLDLNLAKDVLNTNQLTHPLFT